MFNKQDWTLVRVGKPVLSNLSWNFTGKHEYTLINLCKLAFQMIRADEMIKSAVLISSIEHVTFNLLTYQSLGPKTGSEEPGI